MGVIGDIALKALGPLLSGVFNVGALPAFRMAASLGKLPAQFAAALPRVVIVGVGGAGKSTLLKQMLARAAATGRIPLWVQLAALPAHGPLTPSSLIDFLVVQAQTTLGLDASRTFFQELVRDGQIAIGFDALDECGSLVQRQKVRALIIETAREWKRCQVFVTSRPEALREAPLPHTADTGGPKDDQFDHFEPVRFTREDVAPFLRAAFEEDGERLAKELLGRTGIEALLETPLTLSLVGWVARTDKGLPQTRAPLFARCLDTVCETWEDAKGGPSAADGLNAEQRLDVLRRLGWEAQRAGGEQLSAREARTALAPLYPPAAAKTIVDGLARRNLLLRAQTAEDGGRDVTSIRFAHPQFREYLAGAHLAEQFSLDRAAAASLMAAHWIDSSWLETLRFALATLGNDAQLRDGLLAAALNADDPYRELLHRPDFLVARLCARLTAVDSRLLAPVVACLEQTALGEPALRDEAAQLLLGLAHLPAALPAIRRFAEGDGVARAFVGMGERPHDERRNERQWRVRALEALAVASGPAAALALAEAPPSNEFDAILDFAELRARLLDPDGALSLWRRCFDDPSWRPRVADSMDGAGTGKRFDDWLRPSLDENNLTVSDVQLAHRRGIAANYTVLWQRVFEAAHQRLAALSPDEMFAPSEITDAVYAALETDEVFTGAAKKARRELAIAALRHRSLVWFVGPRMGQRMPELAADAAAALTQYVLDAPKQPPGRRPDSSRLNSAIVALCETADDAVAVPALLALLPHLQLLERRASAVARSLARRGHAAEAFQILEPHLALPAQIDDRVPDEQQPARANAWRLAWDIDPTAAVRLLDTMYRAGDPVADARRVAQIAEVSGVVAVADRWFEAISRHVDDARGQQFLQELGALDTATIVEQARRAMGLGAEKEPSRRREWTQQEAERAFDRALASGEFVDEWGNAAPAATDTLTDLLSTIAALSSAEHAVTLADRWVGMTLHSPAAPAQKAAALANQLQALSRIGLATSQWLAPVADFARTLQAWQRAELVQWLNANA